MSLRDATEILDEKPFLKDLVLDEKSLPNKSYGLDISPDPGFCIKLNKSDENSRKTFINVCYAYQVPCPPDIDEADLLKLIESNDDQTCSGYRVPLSIGEPHVEIDNKGDPCTAFDVIIHPRFYSKVQHSSVFLSFLAIIIIDGIESKYKLKLSREWTKLKNKRCMGKIMKQRIRTEPTTLMEVDDKDEIREVRSIRFKDCEYNIQVTRHLDGRQPFVLIKAHLELSSKASDVSVIGGKDDTVQIHVKGSSKVTVRINNIKNLKVDKSRCFYDKSTKNIFIQIPIVRE